MKEIVHNYRNLKRSMGKLIDMSPYRANYLIEALGLSESSYYRKKRDSDFDTDEMLILARIFDTPEMEDKLLAFYAEDMEEKEGSSDRRRREEAEQEKRKQIGKIPSPYKEKIVRVVKGLRNNPYFGAVGAQPLQNKKDLYKIEVGMYRIVLRKVGGNRVKVVTVANCEDIYQ